MTCIIGVLSPKEKCVYIGADSCGSNGYTKSTVGHPKVFRKGDFIIGGTTSFRMLDLLEYSLSLPELRPSDEKDMEKFMRVSFVDAVRACLKNGGFAETNKNAEVGGNFLVGWKESLWEIQPDYSVLTITTHAAVGSGEVAATASLFTTKNLGIIPEKRITMAMEAAENQVVSVQGPFVILSTKKEKASE
jgi:hypothetical protein